MLPFFIRFNQRVNRNAIGVFKVDAASRRVTSKWRFERGETPRLLLGGSVCVESNPGQDARFALTLPLKLSQNLCVKEK